jgi:hypothetical protein
MTDAIRIVVMQVVSCKPLCTADAQDGGFTTAEVQASDIAQPELYSWLL